jgi:hypothetical protein
MLQNQDAFGTVNKKMHRNKAFQMEIIWQVLFNTTKCITKKFQLSSENGN